MASPLPNHYGIVVVGKTGLGKSTTANKLLEARGGPDRWSMAENATDYFVTAEEGAIVEHSVTTGCRALPGNKHDIKVVDTRGFADTKYTVKCGLYKANLQIFREILRAQEEHNLSFRRVLYFLPSRGPLERADGNLQEEIKVMHEFFGEDIFNIMVIIATYGRKQQMCEFDGGDIETSATMFTTAFKTVIGHPLPKCPPILYLPRAETNVLNKILEAEVIDDHPLEKPDVISVTHTKHSSASQRIITYIRDNPGRRLHFQDRCTRCADKIIYEFDPTGKKQPVKIRYWNEEEVLYEDSKCHPVIIPKHYRITKIIGGVVHIVTLGIVAAIQRYRGVKYVPWFTNSEEMCPVCENSPGSDGCKKVGEMADVLTKEGKKESIETSHSTQLDKLQIDVS